MIWLVILAVQMGTLWLLGTLVGVLGLVVWQEEIAIRSTLRKVRRELGKTCYELDADSFS